MKEDCSSGILYISSSRCYSCGTSHATNDRASLDSQFSLVILSVALRFPLFVGEARYSKWKAGGYGLLTPKFQTRECHRARTTREEDLSPVPVLDLLNTLSK